MKDAIAVFFALSAVLFPLGLYQLVELLQWLMTHLRIILVP